MKNLSIGLLKKIRKFYKELPDKKPYIEFITAFLSIPVLTTVIILNINNLRGSSKSSPVPQPVSYLSPVEKIIMVTGSQTPVKISDTKSCNKNLPTVDISYPKENDTISDNPISFIIDYPKTEYCPVVWSYKVSDGKWSDYSDSSISIYNLPSGDTKFYLKIKSLSTGEEDVVTRNFTYVNSSPIPTPDKTASQSAN